MFSWLWRSLRVEERKMAAGAVVSLEEVRQARLHADARQRLHEYFDRWLDQGKGA